jgi:hypothetical protein
MTGMHGRVVHDYFGVSLDNSSSRREAEAIAACVEARAASGMPVTVAIREVEVAV